MIGGIDYKCTLYSGCRNVRAWRANPFGFIWVISVRRRSYYWRRVAFVLGTPGTARAICEVYASRRHTIAANLEIDCPGLTTTRPL